MRTQLIGAALACSLLALAACDTASPPPPSENVGLFDGSSLPTANAAVGTWEWFAVPGMRCRDGSSTGFGVRRAPASDELLIVLQGGGLCFDSKSCNGNNSSFDENDFNSFVSKKDTVGVYEQDEPRNPFREWNVVFMPYCTGDYFGGNATNVTVQGAGEQDFVGFQNMQLMLNTIRSEARNASIVVLSGHSAGGAGTLTTYGLVSDRLAPAPVHVLNDAGPTPPNDDVLTPAYQQVLRSLWNLDDALPSMSQCPECYQDVDDDGAFDDGLENVVPYYAATNPDRFFGLISFTDDCTNRRGFAAFNPNGVPDTCRTRNGIYLPIPLFTEGLLTLRDSSLAPYQNTATFYIDGTGHTTINTNNFPGKQSDGTFLVDWIETSLANPQATFDVGP